ncbi:MAG: ATP-binding protein [Proteobacteria bacterium]|nr:ATP-binding protein [Pseudomonadota bacterium]MBU1387617.1 ATP-binding protein [Pseudomonadota bacterium]MBU1544208.1 ATP-binding protein [Pseudomonadota bacterium]
MESKPIHLNIKSHPRNLARIRKEISNAAAVTNLSEEIISSIILAVDETCSNIIRHSYKNNPDCRINLTIELTRESICITIRDNGAEFDICSAQPRDVTDVKPGGLGIYIIKQVMDNVEYCRTKDGYNQIKLIKKL